LNVEERALSFDCAGSTLVGILSTSPVIAERGILFVVGGPQYRVGSHRQFVLLARKLASCGVPALRFDYRGMGDSDGDVRSFEDVNQDIRCAIDQFFEVVPGMKDVILWGLCDAASAALFYGEHDARVSGLALLNPWIRTARGAARSQLRHYYLQRLFQRGLWRKLVRGEFGFIEAAKALAGSVAHALGYESSPGRAGTASASWAPLPERMADGLQRFKGRILVVLSGNDLTAQEFKDVVARSSRWQRLLADPRVTRFDLADANHTFARRDWRDQVARWTETWVKS